MSLSVFFLSSRFPWFLSRAPRLLSHSANLCLCHGKFLRYAIGIEYFLGNFASFFNDCYAIAKNADNKKYKINDVPRHLYAIGKLFHTYNDTKGINATSLPNGESSVNFL